jgi:hypothetical protein
MIEVQHIEQAPQTFHYCWRRTPGNNVTEGELTAQDYLRHQGCTLILHCEDGISYGIVEPFDVVHQRTRQPRYD